MEVPDRIEHFFEGHEWKVVGVDNEQDPTHTIVLERCNVCKKHRTRFIVGCWTVEDLTSGDK